MLRKHEIEFKVLDIVERVKKKQHIEDFTVELKSKWPEIDEAARQIAAHANAARGEDILWVIGIGEKNGVTGADYSELSNWWAGVRSKFNGTAPSLRDLNVSVDGNTVVALLFETDRAPFVIKNPVFRTPGGGPVEFEVPWREGRSTRSARREDLIQLLTPLAQIPRIAILAGSLSYYFEWELKLALYVESTGDDKIAIPFHKCSAQFHLGDDSSWVEFAQLDLMPPQQQSSQATRTSLTIQSTDTEVIIDGPGKMLLTAWDCTGEQPIPGVEAFVKVTLAPVGMERTITLEGVLRYNNQTGRADGTKITIWGEDSIA